MKNGRPAATEAALVAALLERVTCGDAWHGDNVEQRSMVCRRPTPRVIPLPARTQSGSSCCI